MVVRYFNLKKGSEKVFGRNIRIDTSATSLDKKLSDFNGDFIFSLWTFNLVRREKKDEIYEIIMPNEECVSPEERNALGGKVSVPVALDRGNPNAVKVRLNQEGDLSFYDNRVEGFYLNEITEMEAKNMKRDAKNWAMQRAYMW